MGLKLQSFVGFCVVALLSARRGNCQLGAVAGLAGGLLGGPSKPNIALKVMPSKKMRMTKSDMNSLLLDLKHEVRKQVAELEDQYAQQERLKQKISSNWSRHGAPIFMPNQVTQMPPMPYQPQQGINYPMFPVSQNVPVMGFKQLDTRQNLESPDKHAFSDAATLLDSLEAFSKIANNKELRFEEKSSEDAGVSKDSVDDKVTTGNNNTKKQAESVVQSHLRNGPIKYF